MMVSKPITNAMKDTLAVIIVAKPVYDTLVILRNATMMAATKIIVNMTIIARQSKIKCLACEHSFRSSSHMFLRKLLTAL